MLRHLQVRDLAIIDAVEIDFSRGLTVLTGETGAGKSMLVDALELLAGGRAGAEVVRAGAERADLSATLDLSGVGAELRRVLEEQSIAEEGELIIRRAIGTDGRSRAWLNGQSVPVSLLRTVGELLFDIHGQHEFQSLMRAPAQRELLDGYGQLESQVARVRAAHASWLALMNRSIAVEAAASDRHARLDLLRYQVQELEGVQLKEGEYPSLSEERARIANRGRLAEAARQALDALYDDESANAYALVARSAGALRNASGMDDTLAPFPAQLEGLGAQLQEIGHSLSHYLDSLEFDAGRQVEVERRLAAIEELARKHRVEPAELPAWQAALQRELSGMENAASELHGLRAHVAAALAQYHEQARSLSLARTKAARWPATSPAACRNSAWPAACSWSTSRRSRAPNPRRTAPTGSSSAYPPIPASRPGRSPRSPRAASWRDCPWPCRSAARARRRRAWCSTRWMRASAAPWPRSSAASCARWAKAPSRWARHCA